LAFDLNKITRKNIRNLIPYSSARDEFKGTEGVFLDANENSMGSVTGKDYHRYPDPLQIKVKQKLAALKGVAVENIFLGNGSDEAIDLLLRAFCEPGRDNILIFPPTYGMYEVAANINDVQTNKINLTEEFEIDVEKALAAVNALTKLIFVCSPNNPTANSVQRGAIIQLLENFDGIVVVDEAYIDFSIEQGFLKDIAQYPNLVVLQTFSKAWGMANLRLGIAYSNPALIHILNKIKPPYNVNGLTQQLALHALDKHAQMLETVNEILKERERLLLMLKHSIPLSAMESWLLKVYPSDANFILIKTTEPKALYDFLIARNIVVRDRSKQPLCEGCLRITIGTAEENKMLEDALAAFGN